MTNYCRPTLTKSLWVPKKFFFWLAFGWTIAIAVLCLVSFKKIPSVDRIANADKYVHAAFHFVLTMLWYLYLKSRNPVGNYRKTLITVLLMSFVYGILIELAQHAFTTTRQADVKDVLANFTGGFLAVIALIVYEKHLKKPYIQ